MRIEITRQKLLAPFPVVVPRYFAVILHQRADLSWAHLKKTGGTQASGIGDYLHGLFLPCGTFSWPRTRRTCLLALDELSEIGAGFQRFAVILKGIIVLNAKMREKYCYKPISWAVGFL